MELQQKVFREARDKLLKAWQMAIDLTDIENPEGTKVTAIHIKMSVNG